MHCWPPNGSLGSVRLASRSVRDALSSSPAKTAALHALGGLVDLLVPPLCAGCSAWMAHPLCAGCRAQVPPDREDARLPQLDACVAGVAYAGPAIDWLHGFKYPPPGLAGLDGAATAVAREWAAEAARRAPAPGPERVVPVPLHPRRLRARGFNPAAVLARRVVREVGGRFQPMALARVRDTPTQTGLDRAARRRNVAGAFRCADDVRGTVWLVDDVVTTGATLSACARALRRRGARRVVAICAARTPRAGDTAAARA